MDTDEAKYNLLHELVSIKQGNPLYRYYLRKMIIIKIRNGYHEEQTFL